MIAMRRTMFALIVSLVGCAGLQAAEIKGTFVKFDEPKKLLTINVEGATSEFVLTDETKVMTVKGEPTRQGIKSFANPKVAKAGAVLTVVTDKRDGKDVVTEIRLGGKKK
jgi:hypothetical protein